MELLEDLNIQQQQAVMAGLGPVMVMAGPGSGKTRVLTRRIAYLIGSMGVNPFHILAVTFTNKAAKEMKERVETLLEGRTRGLSLGTFHAICARTLRREAEHLPFTSNYVIYDQDDQISVVKRALKDLNLDEKRLRPYSVHAAISNAKNELLGPEEFPVSTSRERDIQNIFRRYQDILLSSNALDFDDLLLWTARLLEENPEVRERYARRYEHILVDEFQDTNHAQYTLLKHLASFHRNIFVVGDTDQSIYRWRGADYHNLRRFQRDFREAQTILLEQNYRSTQNILDVAMAVIDPHPGRQHKLLFTERGDGQKVYLHELPDDRQEASFIVDTIALKVAQTNAQPGDFAIMYRTNAQSRVLEEAFLHAGLPYKVVGAQRFYGRREVKDVLSYLRLVHNPADEISLVRAINVPPRGIGDKTYAELRTLAQKTERSPGDMLIALGSEQDSTERDALSPRADRALTEFGRLLASWQRDAPKLSPLELLDAILEDVDYRSYIDDGTDEGIDRWENVMELRRVASDFPDPGLDAFLEQVALVSDQDTIESSGNVPTLMTLHAAKGLEFPVVFIAGLNDGVLPHSRSFDDEEEMLEERRLFYVGITRAEDELHLICPEARSSFGYSEPAIPSRFLQDVPEDMLNDVSPGRRRQRRDEGEYQYIRWNNVAPPAAPPVERRYHPGMRVTHSVFGEGMVLNSKLQDDDEIVDVFFEEVGMKRLAASLANLNIQK